MFKLLVSLILAGAPLASERAPTWISITAAEAASGRDFLVGMRWSQDFDGLIQKAYTEDPNAPAVAVVQLLGEVEGHAYRPIIGGKRPIGPLSRLMKTAQESVDLRKAIAQDAKLQKLSEEAYAAAAEEMKKQPSLIGPGFGHRFAGHFIERLAKSEGLVPVSETKLSN